MIRLLMACIVAFSLMPENTAIQNNTNADENESSQLTTHDTLSAVQSTVSDVMGFCDRNVETCLTAQALASEAKQKAMQALNSFNETQSNISKDENTPQIDAETTSTVSQ